MTFADDLRVASRSLRRAPGFTAAVVLVLGLGLGAGIAIFSAVDAVLFRKLAVPESDRLVRFFPHPDPGNWSYPAFRDYADSADALTVAAYSSGDAVNLSVDGRQPERVAASLVSDSFFAVMSVPPAAGRLLAGGGEHAIVLSDAALEKRFGGDPGAVGRSVRLNGHAFTIVGVMPKGFFGPDLDSFPDLWIPASAWKEALPMFAGEEMLTSRGFSWIEVIGRLKPGASLAGAQAQLDTIAARARPDLTERDRLSKARLVRVDDALLGDGSSTKRLAWTLLAAAASVLLLAGSVVAGLLVVRTERRRSEIAVRLAIGASRGDLVHTLLAESVLLSALAGGLGLVVASWVTSVLSASASAEFPIPLAAASPVLALRVLLVTSGTALLVGALCGLPAALRASRGDLVPALGNPRTVVVGQAFADRFFGGNVLGKLLKGVARTHAPVEIVGVVKTAKLRSLREAPQPQVFLPRAQSYLPGMTLVVRTGGSPLALIPSLRSLVGGLDKDIPFIPRTLREHLGVTLSEERLVAGLLTAFGAVALHLATFGLFSVLSFATEIRRREIGIRMALGAEAGDILRVVLTEAAQLTAAGVLLGTAAALGLSSLLSHLLFRVAPTDPATFLSVAGLLSATALLASTLPARRATRVDPIRALRAD